MAATTTSSLSENIYINGVLGETRWATNSLTYSFPASASFYGSSYGSGETSDNFGALSASQQINVRSILSMYSSVANIAFTEVTETSTHHGDIRFARSDAPDTAWAYYPNTAAEGGDVWVNNSSGYYNNPVRGNYAFTTLIHEIGHSFGLDHGHQGHAVPVERDSMEYTVMSYRSYVGASPTSGYTNQAWSFAQSLMMYDIAAIQHLYGANYSINAGNTEYRWSSTSGELSINGVGQGTPGSNRIFQTLWDGGGVDTYDFSNFSTPLTISLAPGEWTTTSANQLAWLRSDGSRIAAGNIANALLCNDDSRSLIENARGGSAGDTIVGNRANNVLWGDAGDDVLDGCEGLDSASYSGRSTDYRWWQNSDRSFTVSDRRLGSPDGADRLYNIDSLVFHDEVVQLVYQTIFDSEIQLAANGFGAAPSSGGWDHNERFPRRLADVNGDGRADVIGFGGDGAFVALANADGTLGATFLGISSFGYSAAGGGWSDDTLYFRELGDVNGDGRADIVGFGSAGTYVSLAHVGGTFQAPILGINSFGASSAAGAWSSNDTSPRELADVNGDGRADIVGFGGAGAFVSFGNADGTFQAPFLAINSFGSSAAGGGWTSDELYHRAVGDVNGDSRADIIGFGAAGTYVALADAGGTFQAPILALDSFGSSAAAGGWSSDNVFSRSVADVNDDGRADIVGFGGSGVFIAQGQADGTFLAPTLDIASFGSSADAGGWSSSNAFPRVLGDVNGDGSADIVGFGSAGVYTALASDILLG